MVEEIRNPPRGRQSHPQLILGDFDVKRPEVPWGSGKCASVSLPYDEHRYPARPIFQELMSPWR